MPFNPIQNLYFYPHIVMHLSFFRLITKIYFYDCLNKYRIFFMLFEQLIIPSKTTTKEIALWRFSFFKHIKQTSRNQLKHTGFCSHAINVTASTMRIYKYIRSRTPSVADDAISNYLSTFCVDFRSYFSSFLYFWSCLWFLWDSCFIITLNKRIQ